VIYSEHNSHRSVAADWCTRVSGIVDRIMKHFYQIEIL